MLDQINAALVSRRDSKKQKNKNINRLTPNFWTIVYTYTINIIINSN